MRVGDAETVGVGVGVAALIEGVGDGVGVGAATTIAGNTSIKDRTTIFIAALLVSDKSDGTFQAGDSNTNIQTHRLVLGQTWLPHAVLRFAAISRK